MNAVWFKRCGWLYRPVSVIGVGIVVLVLAYCAQVFVAVDHHSHSVSDTINGVFPYFATSFLLLNWLAARTSDRRPDVIDA